MNSAAARELRAMPVTPSLHLDDEADARRLVELRGIEPPLEELYRWARSFLAENADQVDTLRAKLAEKYALDGASDAATASSVAWSRRSISSGTNPFCCNDRNIASTGAVSRGLTSRASIRPSARTKRATALPA